MVKIPPMLDLLKKEIQVEVSYCDGSYDTERRILTSPLIRLTGRSGLQGTTFMLEIEYTDYELGLHPEKRLSSIFVPFYSILFIDPKEKNESSK